MHFADLIGRIAGALLRVWCVLTLTFALMRVAPGDPAALLVSPSATPEESARLRGELGLDRPIAVQYARWATGLLRGEWGESFVLRRPVTTVIREALPISLALGIASLSLTFLIGVPIGVLQAAKRGTAIDRVLTVLTTAVYAAPSFWIALAMVGLFTFGVTTLGLPAWVRLPAFGLESPGSSLTGAARAMDIVRHAILPVGILAAVGAAGIARYARTSVADVLRDDFVRTARAKGATARIIYGRHVLAVILPTLVVLFTLALPGVVAGSVFVEAVFAWPGMGRAMLNAIAARDYPVVMGATAVYALLVVLANLASDLILPIVDPRRRVVSP